MALAALLGVWFGRTGRRKLTTAAAPEGGFRGSHE
jgi:hypothetical protein